ncbi:hypothetical protein WMY93_022986 [Mugilogobius chulae]|uniref:Uncharacterized protein n=1 Tax=Mugilogobius chulae TaxID=88201 RepID=A0AAW0NDI6_9GOBI
MQSRRQNSSPDVRVVRSPTDGMFGVRVQVQGIKGQPFVILNSSDQENPRDVSVITHQAGYNPGVTTRRAETGFSATTIVSPSFTSAKRAGNNNKQRSKTENPAAGCKFRRTRWTEPPKSPNAIDTDPFMSVGKLINQFNSSQQQRGRRGPRSRLDLEQCRRSRSADSGRASDSSSSSSSSRASSLRGLRGETTPGVVVYPPGRPGPGCSAERGA